MLYILAFVYSKRFIDRSGEFPANTLLIHGHPDDETVFFTPTVLAIKDKTNLFEMSLSNGNWEGLGKIREVEEGKATANLGFKGHYVVDDPRFQDGPWFWPKGML